jgi:hypothetical protein
MKEMFFNRKVGKKCPYIKQTFGSARGVSSINCEFFCEHSFGRTKNNFVLCNGEEKFNISSRVLLTEKKYMVWN